MRTLATIVATLMLATAMPVSANNDVYDANRAYFADLVTSMGEDATAPEAQQAINEAAARAGNVRLDVVAAAAAPGDEQSVGDIWILEFGVGDCPEPTILAEQGVPPSALHPQLYVYEGPIGSQNSTGSGIIVDWTDKSTSSYGNGVAIQGQSDFYCSSFLGLYFYFPYLTGIAEPN